MDTRTIVVIDNDAAIRAFLHDLFVEEGYTPICITDSAISVTAIQQAQPDLIMLDLCRAGSDATLRLVAELRAHPNTSDMPILVSSTDQRLLAEVHDVLTNLNCLALAKPFSIHRLLEILVQIDS